MSENLVVHVDRFVSPAQEIKACGAMGEKQQQKPEMVGPSSSSVEEVVVVMVDGEENEEAPLIALAECRICQEEDSLTNLETPCACSGSLKYAHRKCVQHWCNEKGDIICEICHQPYYPGYTAPRPNPEETIIDIGGRWQLSGTPLDLHDPRLLAIAEAERQLLEAEYDDYNATNVSGAAFCRSAALILMALLLMRNAMTVTDGDGDGDDDPSTFFSLFLLRAAGFLIPCYIVVWAIGILQRRRQRQEAAALAATQFAFVVQSEQNRGVHFAIASVAPAPAPAPAAALTPRQEHV